MFPELPYLLPDVWTWNKPLWRFCSLPSRIHLPPAPIQTDRQKVCLVSFQLGAFSRHYLAFPLHFLPLFSPGTFLFPVVLEFRTWTLDGRAVGMPGPAARGRRSDARTSYLLGDEGNLPSLPPTLAHPTRATDLPSLTSLSLLWNARHLGLGFSVRPKDISKFPPIPIEELYL